MIPLVVLDNLVAFNAIDHTILLSKLWELGDPGSLPSGLVLGGVEEETLSPNALDLWVACCLTFSPVLFNICKVGRQGHLTALIQVSSICR